MNKIVRKIKCLWYTILHNATKKDVYFWLMMKYAYNPRPGGLFGMCGYSRLFSDRWLFNRGDILEPARLWIQTQDTSEYFEFNRNGYLFYFRLDTPYPIAIQERVQTIELRKNFIKHMIEQCKKN